MGRFETFARRWVWLGIGCLAALSACDTGPQITGQPGAGGDPASAVWPYWPRSMRVHPLTRIMAEPESEHVVIEARIEFSDAFNSTTRGVGQLQLELYEPAPGGGTLMEQWAVDLRDPTTNAERFDDITRTYLFRLRLYADRLSEAAQLRAYFLSEDGTRLSGQLDLDR